MNMDERIKERMEIEFYDGLFSDGGYNDKSTIGVEVNEILALRTPDHAIRSIVIETLCDAYLEQTGLTPPGGQLQRLANWYMIEVVTDPRPDKVALEEYPFLTKRQRITRYRREFSSEFLEKTRSNDDHQKPDKSKYTQEFSD